jgi:hypothetical protein
MRTGMGLTSTGSWKRPSAPAVVALWVALVLLCTAAPAVAGVSAPATPTMDANALIQAAPGSAAPAVNPSGNGSSTTPPTTAPGATTPTSTPPPVVSPTPTPPITSTTTTATTPLPNTPPTTIATVPPAATSTPPASSTPTPTASGTTVTPPCTGLSASGASAGSCGAAPAGPPGAGLIVTTPSLTGGASSGSQVDPSSIPQKPDESVSPSASPVAPEPAAADTEPAPPTLAAAPAASPRSVSGHLAHGTDAAPRHSGGPRRKTSHQAGYAALSALPPRLLPVVAGTAARSPLLGNFAGPWALASPASTSAHDLSATQSPAPSSVERSLAARRAHGVVRNGPDSSPAVEAPPQPEFDAGTHGPRRPQGVGVSVPGGTAAPSSLMLTVTFPRIAGSRLRFVTGVSIHFQCPETHRLERPG